jgi:predicted  nucleic acid-binding Zn-ribbon protein
LHRFFCRIAGVDPVVLEDCPNTDRIWAAQLGFSLVLNFFLVFSLTFYSVGYFLPDLYGRVLVAFVVAAVLTMFDRALFQFDWFTVALLQDVREFNPRTSILQGLLTAARVFWRLSLRLAISLAIAYTLSVFAEIAVFDSAIRERMTAENFAENELYHDKLAKFERGLDEQRAALGKRIAHLETEIDAVQRGAGSPAEQDEYELLRMNASQIRARIAAVEITLAGNDERIRGLNEDIYAERYGLKDKPHRTGRPGCEPNSVCYDMVLTVKELQQTNTSLRKDIETLQTRAQELDDKASDFLRRRNAGGDEVIVSKRQEIATLRAEVSAFDGRRNELLSNYSEGLKRDGSYRPLRDDPMIRIRILDELRQDPVRGPAITSMSYLIRAFIAFLELAPVLAKIFFAPPTVYSARIRTAVVLGQHRALRERDEQLSLPANAGFHVYSFDSMNLGDDERRARAPVEQLGNSQPKMLALSERSSGLKGIEHFSLDALNQFGMSKLGEWIEADPDHKRSAGDYYTARLAQGHWLLDADLAIVAYCQRHFDRKTRFFELGFGFGELSLSLVLSGFHTVGFESDAGRYSGASALSALLAQQGIDIGNLSLSYGNYPDTLRIDGNDLDSESVFVSTNVTSTLMMETIDRVMRSLRLFDHLIIDLSRFGEVRDASSQRALIAELQKLGFRQVAWVYASGDTDIRHFQRKPAEETD